MSSLSAKPRPTKKGGKSRSSLEKMWVCHNISNNKIQFREIKSFYTWVYFHIIFFIGSYNRNKIKCPALSAKPRPTQKGGKSRSSLKKMWVCQNISKNQIQFREIKSFFTWVFSHGPFFHRILQKKQN